MVNFINVMNVGITIPNGKPLAPVVQKLDNTIQWFP